MLYVFILVLNMANASSVEAINRQIELLSGREQLELAKLIVSKSKKHNIDPRLVTAIAAKESMLGSQRYNAKSQDYGIMQINIRNIRAYGWNADLILTDDEYGLEAG